MAKRVSATFCFPLCKENCKSFHIFFPSDVNECKENPCSYQCRNTQGSYQCICREGMLRLTDRRTCVGNPTYPNEALTSPDSCPDGHIRINNICAGKSPLFTIFQGRFILFVHLLSSITLKTIALDSCARCTFCLLQFCQYCYRCTFN